MDELFCSVSKLGQSVFKLKRVELPDDALLRWRIYSILRLLLVGFLLVSVVNLLFSLVFYTPKMYKIVRQNKELIVKYDILRAKISDMSRTLDEIKHRDNAVYRSLFGLDTLSIDGIYAPYPDTKYASMAGDFNSRLMIDTWKSLDAVGRRLYLQSKSLDQLQLLSKDKEKMATSIPAIMPINRSALHGGHIGAFGWRNHPISHRYAFHKGIDLGSNVGTPVYATADGVVSYTCPQGTGFRGYGKHLIINHGFGYQTKYAHLNQILVKQGQAVRRGEIIGEVGRTGSATGPHLHYEVIYMGVPVNPLNYFRRDMAATDFEQIVQSATSTTYESEFGTDE